MNKSNENIEPKTDLELALNYSGHCTRKDSDDDSGAGANAASRVDMSLVTNNPVSELVWSPVKGPRVKCTDSSLTDNKTSHFWDIGPSNIFSLVQGVTGVMFSPDKLIDDGSSPHHNNDAGCIRERQEANSTIELSLSHANPKDHTMNKWGKDIPVQAEVMNSGVPEKNETLFAMPGHVDIKTPDNLFLEAEETKTDLPVNEQCGGNVGTSNKLLEADNTLAREIQHTFRHEVSSSPVTSSGRLVGEKESTAENESQTFNNGSSPVALCKIAISLNSHGNENKCQENALVLQFDKNSQPSCCPTSSRTHHHLQKRKGKVLSDGDERISNEDDNSHESVESCDSARHFSTGKKQWNFKQQFGSKRVKRSFHETLDSPPSIRRDSSFMNWISNMLKGFSQLRQHEVTPSALTFGHSDNDHEMLNQKLVKLSKDQYPGCGSVGFRSIFQSIYSSSSKNTETRKLSVNQQLEANAMTGELVNKLTSNTPMPIACCPEGGTCRKQVAQSSEGFKGSPCPNEVVPLSKVEVPRKFVNDEEMELANKNSCSLEMSKEKERMTSTSYFGEHETNIGTDVVFEGIPSPINRKKDVHGSLWITRFSSKSIAPVLDAHQLQISDAGCLELHQATCNATNEDFRTVEAKENASVEKLPSEARQILCGTVSNESSGAKSAKPSYDQKSVDELNNIYHFPRLKSPEVMASLFSRRSDALKHNVPSNLEDVPARASMICGVKGFRNCRPISGNGVKDLPKNITPYERLEGCPSLHAEHSEVNPRHSECHDVFSSGKHVSQVSTSLNHDTPCGMHVNAGNEENALHIACEEGNCQAPTVHVIEQRLKEGIHSMNKSNRLLTDERLGSESSNQNNLEENARNASCNTDKQRVSNIPEGIFEAIKKLQLSRSDILKWINSPMLASQLDGFFLRLRLGKWEKDLGGTGYHVAYITGSCRQSLVQNDKTSVSVNVKGVKCLVESQYISNHHFLEDELVTWWSTTSKGGDNGIPSERELIERIKKKESLGF